MSQAIRGADRWRERTKQTTAFPNERLRRRRSVRWGSLGWERKKSKEPSMFGAEAPGLGLFLMSFLVQCISFCHYWTIKLLTLLSLSIYAITRAITHVPITVQGHARVLDKTVSLFEGGAGKSFCSHSEQICLLDLCDTSLGFVLPPPRGRCFGHVKLGGDPESEPGHAGMISFPINSWIAPVVSWRSWRR